MRYRYTYRDCQEVRRRRRAQRLIVITVAAGTVLFVLAFIWMVLP